MSNQHYTYKPGDRHKKKSKNSILLPAITVCALVLELIAGVRRHTIYEPYRIDLYQVPLLSLVFDAMQENIYPWTDTAEVLGEDGAPGNGGLFGLLGDGETEAADTSETEDAETADAADGTETETEVAAVETESEVLQETEETVVPDEPLTFTTVTDVYFEDAVFLGDSRMEGLSLYCKDLDEIATFYAKPSLSVYTLLKKAFIPKDGGGKMTIPEALSLRQYGKVYIMVGINGIDVGTTDYYKDHYKEVIDEIRGLQPDAMIYICSIMHVTKHKSQSDRIFANSKIDAMNTAASELADGETIFYLDMNEPVDDEEGNLRSDLTGDGVHLKGSAYEPWHQYLLTHAIVRPGIDITGIPDPDNVPDE